MSSIQEKNEKIIIKFLTSLNIIKIKDSVKGKIELTSFNLFILNPTSVIDLPLLIMRSR